MSRSDTSCSVDVLPCLYLSVHDIDLVLLFENLSDDSGRLKPKMMKSFACSPSIISCSVSFSRISLDLILSSCSSVVVGLTGGIASGLFPPPRSSLSCSPSSDALSPSVFLGKSTVSSIFKGQDVPLIDLDVLARVAVEPNSYALSALVSHFGQDILKSDGELNREKLGSIVFNNEKERKVLNSIVHPAVRRLLAWELLKNWIKGEKVCVVDAPLLIEAGLWRFCGAIVVVYW